MLEKLRGVDGYLSDDEAWALYVAARGRKRIVEIGSYKGRSTIAIGSALADRGNGTLVSIDPHRPTGKASYAREHGDLDTRAEFEGNVARAGVAAYVTPMHATSLEARAAYDMQPIDMLFVDGSHDYEDVLADIDAWTPLLSAGAVAAFNDPYGPGVNRALRERLLGGGVTYSEFRHVNNTLFALANAQRSSSIRERLALKAYLYVERMRFKLLKLTLKGLFEALGIVYVRPDALRSLGDRGGKVFSAGQASTEIL